MLSNGRTGCIIGVQLDRYQCNKNYHCNCHPCWQRFHCRDARDWMGMEGWLPSQANGEPAMVGQHGEIHTSTSHAVLALWLIRGFQSPALSTHELFKCDKFTENKQDLELVTTSVPLPSLTWKSWSPSLVDTAACTKVPRAHEQTNKWGLCLSELCVLIC